MMAKILISVLAVLIYSWVAIWALKELDAPDDQD